MVDNVINNCNLTYFVPVLGSTDKSTAVFIFILLFFFPNTSVFLNTPIIISVVQNVV